MQLRVSIHTKLATSCCANLIGTVRFALYVPNLLELRVDAVTLTDSALLRFLALRVHAVLA